MPRWFAALVALLASTALAPPAAPAAEPVVLRLAHVGFPGSIFDISATEFARRVNTELKGKVEIISVMSTVDPRFGVFEMPYIKDLLFGSLVFRRLPADVQEPLARIASELGDFARAEGERLDRELLPGGGALVTAIRRLR